MRIIVLMLLCTIALPLLAEAGNEAPPSPAQLAAFNEKKCTGGDVDACMYLAENYYYGRELPKNHGKARIFYRHACTKGNADACSNLGAMFENGEGGGRDWNSAEANYKKSCDGGSGLGCNNLAVLYERRALKEPKFLGKTLDAYNSACAMQYGDTCARAEKLQKYAETDPKKKMANWEIACSGSDDFEACHKAGSAYYLGDGIARSLPKAIGLFKRACDGGWAASCYNIAIMMEQGELPRDAKQILATYDKACDKGDARACSNAGFMYINGDGAPLDQEMGRVLFEKSCTLKHGEGCYNLGNVYESGAGIEKDPAKAVEYYTLACTYEHKKACDALKAAKKGGKKK